MAEEYTAEAEIFAFPTTSRPPLWSNLLSYPKCTRSKFNRMWSWPSSECVAEGWRETADI